MELLFGGCGSLFVYQMGVCHSWLKHTDRIKYKTVLQKLKVGGVSGGSIVAAYFIAAVHTDHDMEYWYFTHIRPALVRAIKNQKFITFKDSIFHSGKELYNRFENNPNGNNVLKEYFHVGVTVWNDQDLLPRSRILMNIGTDTRFAEALSGSCYIPFYTGKSFFSLLDKNFCLDGGLSVPIPRLNKTSKCMFVSIFGLEKFLTDNTTSFLDLNKYGNYSIFDFHISNDILKYDFMYRQGLQDGKKSAEIFKKYISQ